MIPSSWIPRGMEWIRGLLQASSISCVWCGQSLRREGMTPGLQQLVLCRRCLKEIPWIREIKCSCCGRPDPCADCARRLHPHFIQNRSAVRYDAHMKEWMARYKYRGDERLSILLGTMLVQAFRQYPQEVARSFHVVSFVPVSEERIRERGFNQAEQMARAFLRTAGIGLPILPLLVRTRHTGKQSLKSRGERLRDLSGVFALHPGAEAVSYPYRPAEGPFRILLLDDIYTTGSTMDHCAAILQAVWPSAEVYGLCWAR